MISIKKYQIPKYLHNSNLYKNLDDDEDSFEIPKKNFKKDEIINDLSDFNKLIDCICYFDGKFPKTVKKYYYKNSIEIINHYLISGRNINYETEGLFKYLFNLEIKSFEQFISSYIIIKI